MMSSKIVLDYGDYIVRESDIYLLESPQWLNDTLIGFYFEYLSKTTPSRLGSGEEGSPSPTCHFVGPEVTQLLKLLPAAEISSVLSNLTTAIVVHPYSFFALNDSSDPSRHNGGSHWSLLIYSQTDTSFLHFDSASKSNEADAMIITAKLKNFTNSAPLFHVPYCQQQSNSSDCGLHLLKNAQLIAKYIIEGKGEDKKKSMLLDPIENGPTASPKEADDMRTELKYLIKSLAKKE